MLHGEYYSKEEFYKIVNGYKQQYQIKLSNNEKKIINDLLYKNYLIIPNYYYEDNSYIQSLLNEFVIE
jgi:hypothetical protein